MFQEATAGFTSPSPASLGVVSLLWVLRCFLTSPGSMKVFPQTGQACFLSPV